MAEQTAETDFDEETIKVVGYPARWPVVRSRTGSQHLGHGGTFEEAVDLLEELIQDQIEFCNENGMSYHYPAEERYFRLYEELKNSQSGTEGITKLS